MHETFATHFIVELWDVKDYLYFKDVDKLVKEIKNLLLKTGNTYLDHKVVKFDNNSYSASFIIAESHLNLHTWPEHNYIGLDFYSCNKTIDGNLTIEILKNLFKCEGQIMVLRRGMKKSGLKMLSLINIKIK